MSLLTDATLTVKTKAALLADEGLAGAGINVDTLDAVVTLRGRVPTEALRELAESLAVACGAREVVNDLEVTHARAEARSGVIPPGTPGVTATAGAPPALEPRAEAVLLAELAADERINEHLIDVRVNNGVARLSGRQDTIEAHHAAIEVAAHTRGIIAVEDWLEVAPSV
jgi:hyperosmotically inducible periplasmic protein